MQELPGWMEFVDVQELTGMLIGYVPKVLAAVLVLLAFGLLVRLTRPALRGVLVRADFAPGLVDLLADHVYRYGLYVIGGMMAASQLGINIAAALGTLGIAGIAVGFAAQDSLANSIAGFMIFWDKPFAVGQYITTVGDLYGRVTEITLRTTRIRTPDNTWVILPNSEIIEQPLVNHSMYGELRVNVPVAIAYKEDTRRAREVLLERVAEMEGILDDPAPAVVVKELGDSSVELLVRVWVESAADERPVSHALLEASKLALDEAGIEIPFPHLQLFVDDVEERVWEGAAKIPARMRADPGDSLAE